MDLRITLWVCYLAQPLGILCQWLWVQCGEDDWRIPGEAFTLSVQRLLRLKRHATQYYRHIVVKVAFPLSSLQSSVMLERSVFRALAQCNPVMQFAASHQRGSMVATVPFRVSGPLILHVFVRIFICSIRWWLAQLRC
ncbi:hypothetical protein OBBRIDRAFT_572608 [Obba rivulosa]|uniref:Uncharacterized protein n=1 Tax=Obba rivulosa TaxID=1052685 RepID=A0A8E2DNP8_9APHY|nr:hypothetical protein OBBRIDRAFT_572608 [Obba rivulosa]